MTDLKNISTTCGCSKYGEPSVEAIDRGPGCCAERDEAATGTDDLGCCGQDCCGAEDEAAGDAGRSEIDVAALRRNLDIEFFYLDLSVCERCQGTEAGLEDALGEVSRVLEEVEENSLSIAEVRGATARTISLAIPKARHASFRRLTEKRSVTKMAWDERSQAILNSIRSWVSGLLTMLIHRNPGEPGVGTQDLGYDDRTVCLLIVFHDGDDDSGQGQAGAV